MNIQIRRGNAMRLGQLFAAVGLGVGAWLLPLGSASAGTVMYDSAGFIQGQQSFVEAFNITSPGTLTISLSSVSWLDPVTDLNAFVSTSSGVIGSTMGPGTESTNVAPGTIYVHWFGDASGAYDLGVYGLKVTFQPTASPVPLPTSVLLLLSGFAFLLIWMRRREVASCPAYVASPTN
jgi:hypothetical protein